LSYASRCGYHDLSSPSAKDPPSAHTNTVGTA